MNKQELLNIFEETGALQYGHFILSSGKRSGTYCQCSRLFINPKTSNIIGNALANKVESKINEKIDYVIAPALGGILVGYEVARCLNSKSIFFERTNEEFELRRGFEIEQNKNILFIEDVITTGKSSKECLKKLFNMNINILGIACIVDRSQENIFDDHEIISLLKLDIPTYDSDNLPEDLINIEPVKPGSRKS
jgi:orotate phosphoribosyltransferase